MADADKIVRAWIVTPPADFVHPKTKVLIISRRQPLIALRVRKISAGGAMRVVAQGVSEQLAAFNGELHHQQKDHGWLREDDFAVTDADRASFSDAELRVVVRSDDAVTSGVGSSGRAQPPAAGAASPVDSGSTASSRLILREVKLERERGDTRVAAAEARAAKAAEAAAAASAREAATREASIATLMKVLKISRADAEAELSKAL